MLALGVYPDVTLADARNKRNEAKRVIAAGSDPSDVKQAIKNAWTVVMQNNVEPIANTVEIMTAP